MDLTHSPVVAAVDRAFVRDPDAHLLEIAEAKAAPWTAGWSLQEECKQHGPFCSSRFATLVPDLA